MVTVDFSATIRRGVSALISFVVSIAIPSKGIACLLAAIPIIVAIQVARAVATRSVGEKDSPFPSLSTGASVSSLASEGPWTAEQCNCPSYLTEILTKGADQFWPAPGLRAQPPARPRRNIIPEPATAPRRTFRSSRVIERR